MPRSSPQGPLGPARPRRRKQSGAPPTVEGARREHSSPEPEFRDWLRTKRPRPGPGRDPRRRKPAECSRAQGAPSNREPKAGGRQREGEYRGSGRAGARDESGDLYAYHSPGGGPGGDGQYARSGGGCTFRRQIDAGRAEKGRESARDSNEYVPATDAKQTSGSIEQTPPKLGSLQRARSGNAAATPVDAAMVPDGEDASRRIRHCRARSARPEED